MYERMDGWMDGSLKAEVINDIAEEVTCELNAKGQLDLRAGGTGQDQHA
jgi:hypothetical protein